MFILKKILTPFLLPPGIFVIFLIFSGGWFLFKKNWKPGITTILVGCVMWLLSISPVSDAMLRGLESEFDIPKNPQGDVIILLGAGVYDQALDLSGVGAPSETMFVRIVTAVRLQKKLNIPIIVSGGKIFEHRTAEAPIVRRFLVDLGVPASEVIMEDKSRDTYENAKFVREICGTRGYKNPILVTSAYHMKRSIMSFEKVRLKITPFPADFRTWENKQYGWKDYLPLYANFRNVSVALKQYLGLVFYEFAY